jgi:2-polyprenyl-3-methyl-5-hydroxy-6-metoxy-1,4-benzoquinol methylase
MALPDKCPLCYAGPDKQAVVTSHVFGGGEGRSHAFFHCHCCDVRYQHPGLSPEEEARFYAAEFEGFMASRAGNKGGWHKAEEHIAANDPTRHRRMIYLSPHLNSNSNLLEVGCSSGFMLLPLKEAGHSCTGIEPSGVFSEFVKSRGLTVYDSLDQLQRSVPNAQFDIILHFFVLEHIADPLSFLKAQLALLKPGGKIIFEIPNAADPLYSVYDIPAFERFYWSVAHPWYFSELSMHHLLKQLACPYEILRDQRYDLSNHMIWARDGRPGGIGRFTKLLGQELEESYKQALIRIGKCDTLVGIISKE